RGMERHHCQFRSQGYVMSRLFIILAIVILFITKGSAFADPAKQSVMTMQEAEALRLQMAKCWSVSAGHRDIGPIHMHLILNPDRTLKLVWAQDTKRYQKDASYRKTSD